MKTILLSTLIICLLNEGNAQDNWIQKTNYAGNGRYGTIGFSIGSKGYVGLGYDDSNAYNDFWEYDPGSDVWTQKADFSGPARREPTGFSIGNKGYIGAGSLTSGDFNWVWYKDFWEYDPSTNAWTQKADFGGQERYQAVGFGIGGKGYMGVGSYRQDRAHNAVYLNDFWEYDQATNKWSQKKDVPELGRSSAFGMSIGSKGYIGFGYYYYDTRKSDLWEYNPPADKWIQKTDFPGGGRVNVTGLSIGNVGYIGTGWYYSGFNDWWEFNPAGNFWTQKTNFPGGVRDGGTAFSIGNKGYVGTGSDGVGGKNDFWEYTPASCPPTGPKLRLLGNNILIYDGDNTPSTSDFTDFGIVDVNTTKTGTFTIKNTGTEVLNISDVNFSGDQKSDFKITTAPALSIAMGDSTHFTVQYSPLVDGIRKTSMHILYNNTCDSDFVVTISGKSRVEHCTPQIRYSCNYMWITNVVLGSISNATACNGYTDYSTSLSTLALAGESINYGVAVAGYPQTVNIYADYNNDGDFTDANELASTAYPSPASPAKGSFSIPSSQPAGKYVVRVISEYTYQSGLTPCNTTYGEAEDYLLVVKPSCTMPTINVPSAMVVNNDLGKCSAVVNYIVATTGDPAPTLTYSFSGATIGNGIGDGHGSTFNKGATMVAVTASNVCGSATGNFSVTVNDNEAPVITCPPAQTFCFDNTGNYKVPLLIAKDNCAIKSVNFVISGSTSRTGTGLDASGIFSNGLSLINWNVADSTGNVSACETKIIVDEPIEAFIPDAFAVPVGGNVNTIHIGYGPSVLTLTALASGGTPYSDSPYHYLWSDNSTSKSVNVNPSSVGKFTYSVTVSDSYGCTASAETTITVEDVRCGNKLDKVLICQVPPGNPNNAKSICISSNAVPVQLAKGSHLNACPRSDDISFASVSAFPNPSQGSFTLQFSNMNASKVELRVADHMGAIIATRVVEVSAETNNLLWDLNLPKGIYILTVSDGHDTFIQKLLVD